MSPRNGAPTRAAILDAAAALLESGGPDAVTLRSVGAAAGVSRSAPYRHFDDKVDLLLALATETLSELGAHIRAGAAAHGQRSQLYCGCAAYVTYALEKPHHYQLVFGDAPVAEPDHEVEAAADDGMLALRELVEQGQADGELELGASPREIATLLWVLLHGLTQLQITGHLREPRTVDGEVALDQLLTLALQALRPR